MLNDFINNNHNNKTLIYTLVVIVHVFIYCICLFIGSTVGNSLFPLQVEHKTNVLDVPTGFCFLF